MRCMSGDEYAVMIVVRLSYEACRFDDMAIGTLLLNAEQAQKESRFPNAISAQL